MKIQDFYFVQVRPVPDETVRAVASLVRRDIAAGTANSDHAIELVSRRHKTVVAWYRGDACSGEDMPVMRGEWGHDDKHTLLGTLTRKPFAGAPSETIVDVYVVDEAPRDYRFRNSLIGVGLSETEYHRRMAEHARRTTTPQEARGSRSMSRACA